MGSPASESRSAPGAPRYSCSEGRACARDCLYHIFRCILYIKDLSKPSCGAGASGSSMLPSIAGSAATPTAPRSGPQPGRASAVEGQGGCRASGERVCQGAAGGATLRLCSFPSQPLLPHGAQPPATALAQPASSQLLQHPDAHGSETGAQQSGQRMSQGDSS